MNERLRLFPLGVLVSVAAASIHCGPNAWNFLEPYSRGDNKYDDSDMLPASRFLNFSLTQESLPSSINAGESLVRIEVFADTDIANLAPSFELPAGYSAYVGDVLQESGVSSHDFTSDIIYEIRDDFTGDVQDWVVSVEKLQCRIIVDASHGGGGWWYPQWWATGFDPDAWHQGKPFADTLRAKGFEVTELAHDIPLTDDLFFGHYIVLRVGEIDPYRAAELEVYKRLLQRGMNLLLFTDHKKHIESDRLAEHLGLWFYGSAMGAVVDLTPHPITQNIGELPYIAGSVLTFADNNPDITVLGRIPNDVYADLNFNGKQDADEPVGLPVMGVLAHPTSKIFFIGDSNALEIQPQPFIDNLVEWVGACEL